MLAVRLKVHWYHIVALIWISFIMNDGEILLMRLSFIGLLCEVCVQIVCQFLTGLFISILTYKSSSYTLDLSLLPNISEFLE